MLKLSLITTSAILVLVGACGNQLVEFAESSNKSAPVVDAGNKPVDAGKSDSSDTPDADKPVVDSGDNQIVDAGPDSGTGDDDDSSNPPPGKNCEYQCGCAKTSCEQDCDSNCSTDWEKSKCVYDCKCDYDDCMNSCTDCNCKQ